MSNSVAQQETQFCDKAAFSPLATELLSGLKNAKKFINPKFFYNDYGSQLFTQITQTPEYYPTRTEKALLQTHASTIAKTLGKDIVLIEPGAGSCEKAQLLIPHLDLAAFVPQDISSEYLYSVSQELKRKFPYLEIQPQCCDFAQGLSLNAPVAAGKKVVFYPGSTLGNFYPQQALSFLQQARHLIDDDGGVLIGIDLIKDHAILNAAYNDQAGITAEFNLNILDHANRILDANFDLDNFKHLAFFNDKLNRIEMHLESTVDHLVYAGGEIISFKQGERIHTECSYKYTLDSFAELAHKAGLKVEQYWSDEQQWFGVFYLTPES